MPQCRFCGNECDFKSGDLAIHFWVENISKYPVSVTHSEIVRIHNPKCIYSYKTNVPTVVSHDYICKPLIDSSAPLTFPVTRDKLSRYLEPNDLLKEIIQKGLVMTENKDNVNELNRISHKNNEKNRLKQKKREAKEKKKQQEKAQKKEQDSFAEKSP